MRLTPSMAAAMLAIGLAASPALAAGPASKFSLRVPGVTQFEFPHDSRIELPRSRVEQIQKQKDALIDLEFAMAGRAAKRINQGSLNVRFNDEATTPVPFEVGDGILVQAHRKDRSKVFAEVDRLRVEIYSASQVSAKAHESTWDIYLIDEPLIRSSAGRTKDGPIFIEIDEPGMPPLLQPDGGSQTVAVAGILGQPSAVSRFLVGGKEIEINRTLSEAEFRVDVPVDPQMSEIVVEAQGAEAHAAIIIPLHWGR